MENNSLAILAQYIRKLDVFNPGILEIMGSEKSEAPKFEVDVQVKAGELTENLYEVLLVIKVQANRDEKEFFHVNLDYAAVAKVEESEEEILKKTLLVNVPTFLFPFARAIISDATRDCGYPPLFLSTVNFNDLYSKKQESFQ